MTRRIARIALVVVAAGSWACGGGERPGERTPEPPLPVTVAAVAARETAERLEAGGVITARESATISSRTIATIAGIRVKAGDRVQAGDVLVTLDARDLAAHTEQTRASEAAAEKALTRARTERAAAEADHRLAAAWHARIAQLHARRSATDQERDEAEARLTAAAARIAGVEAGIEGAEAQLAAARAAAGAAAATESYLTIRAPFDALITERLSDPGNLAVPGVALLRLESEGARQVTARVDEARAGLVKPGDRVTVVLEAASPDGTGAGGVDGVVAEVARDISAGQRAFTVTIDVPPAIQARSGSFARVLFRGAPRRALFVPEAVIRRHGQVSSVYVVRDGIARLRLIQVGPPSTEGIEVLAGLDAGESVVVAPLARVTDGSAVAIGRPTSDEGATP